MVAAQDKRGWEGLVRGGGTGDERLRSGRYQRVGSGGSREKLCNQKTTKAR